MLTPIFSFSGSSHARRNEIAFGEGGGMLIKFFGAAKYSGVAKVVFQKK